MIADPSLENDYIEFHQSQFQLYLKSQSYSFSDIVMARLFQQHQGFKIELTSQTNISFFYLLVVTRQELQNLVEIPQNHQIQYLKDIFSGKYKYSLTLETKETAILSVSVQQKYKEYQLATFTMQKGQDNEVKASVMYRYQRMKLREKMLDQYYENVCQVIRIKNPSLFGLLEQKHKKNAFK